MPLGPWELCLLPSPQHLQVPANGHWIFDRKHQAYIELILQGGIIQDKIGSCQNTLLVDNEGR